MSIVVPDRGSGNVDAKARVLIVDDEEHLRRAASRALSLAGYEVLEAETGQVGMERIRANHLDLVLLDRVLPDADGLDLCHQIKADPASAHLFVALFSALKTSGESRARGLEAGADGYITRPISNRELVAQVEALLRIKRAEDALRESEKKYRLLAQNTLDVIWQMDLNLTFTYVNPAIHRMFGYRPEEFIGTSLADHASEENLAQMSAVIARELEDLEAHTGVILETELFHRNGSSVPVEIHGKVVVNERGEPTALQGTTRDITERRGADKALRESEARFRTTFERAVVGKCLTDVDGHFIALNEALCRMLGYSQEELVGTPISNLTHPDDLEASFESVNRMLAGEESAVRVEKRYVHKEGHVIWALVGAFLFRDPDGEPQYFITHIQDITDRKKAEERVHRLLDHQVAVNELALALGQTTRLDEIYRIIYDYLQDLMDVSAFFVSGYDDEHQLIYAEYVVSSGTVVDTAKLPILRLNEQGGGTQSQVIRTGEPLYVSDYRQAVKKSQFEYQVRGQTGEVVEGPPPTMSYAPRTQSAIYAPMKVEGRTVGVMQVQSHRPNAYSQEEIDLLCALANVSAIAIQNTRLLEKMSEQAQQVRQIISTVPEGVVLLDADLRVLLVNPAARQFLDVLTDTRWSEVLTHLGGRPIEELLTSPTRPGLWHELTVEDSEFQVFEMIAKPMENGAENQGWVLVLRDVTQERAVQQQLQQQERLAAVGQLAAGIAHDFNNIMAVIVLYSGMSLRSPELTPKLRDRMKTISQQADRATDLIQQILDFSRRSVLERRPLNLTPFLKEVTKLLERTLPENIDIELSHGADEYLVEVDPTRLQQVIMNLAVNARDAMPKGGRLRIALDRLHLPSEKNAPLPDMVAGEWLRMTVSDTGVGIPAEALPHIFEPFFTTKERGAGTGLGLAQVYGIVKQHEGHLDVISKAGRGTSFVIYLPALLVAESAPFVPETVVVEEGQGETVLLVEDNAATREALIDSLKLLNYRVLDAVNGREAEVVYEQREDEIDLVLSDVVMPEMGGVALFHALKQRNPDIKMVLLTGHALDEEWIALEQQGVSGRLQKPPSLERLAGLLRQVLTGE